MAHIIDTLQAAIEKKAEERLLADLNTIKSNLLIKVGLIGSIHEEFDSTKIKKYNRKGEWKGDTMELDIRSWFWSTRPGVNDSYGFKHLRRKYLPKYIDRETKEFIKSVSDLKGQMAELEDYYGFLNEQHNE